MKINWLVRFKNKQFCLALVASLLMLAQVVAALFGDDAGAGRSRRQAEGTVHNAWCSVCWRCWAW